MMATRSARARKRRKKDLSAQAKAKRQCAAVRAKRQFLKTVITAAAKGSSEGAVRAALERVATQHGVDIGANESDSDASSTCDEYDDNDQAESDCD